MSPSNSKTATVVHTVKPRPAASQERNVTELNRELQRKLLMSISESHEKTAALERINDVIADAVRSAVLIYLERDGAQSLRPCKQSNQDGVLPLGAEEKLLRWGETTCQHGSVQINELLGAHNWVAVTVPVMLRGCPPEVMCGVFRKGRVSLDAVVSSLQVAASHVTLWHVLQDSKAAEAESQKTAALLELLGKLDSSPDLTHACYTLVNELQSYLSCEQIALGLCGNEKVDCKLIAVSGLSDFDKRSDFTAGMEAALNEAILRDDVTVWPPADDAQRDKVLAHQKLCSASDVEGVVSSPLYSDEGEAIAAWLFLGNADFARGHDTLNFVRASQQQVGSRLHLLQRTQLHPLIKRAKSLIRNRRAWRVQAGVLVVCSLIAALFIPMNYRIGCDCEIEPVSKRFVAAPHAGTLAKSEIEPGDLVQHGQVLAYMDGRELRWELAGVEADYSSAKKNWEAAAAIDETVEAQQAAIEMERLRLKMQLVEHRLENLEIKSPIDGIVIAGDLKKTEGAPLKIGQTLYEIGPLDEMIVEVAIPERDIQHVSEGMEVRFRMDAAPHEDRKGTIDRIFPRSEIRNDESVYIAEVSLDNTSGLFRPGMKGSSTIISEPHALGWNLFHKAWDSLAMIIGW